MPRPKSAFDKDNPDDPRHGTVNAYTNLGCRCDRCREAQRARRKKDPKPPREARPENTLSADDASDPRHGTPTGYRRWGCRCDRCVEAHREANRASYARARVQKVTGEAGIQAKPCGTWQKWKYGACKCNECYMAWIRFRMDNPDVDYWNRVRADHTPEQFRRIVANAVEKKAIEMYPEEVRRRGAAKLAERDRQASGSGS